MRDVKLNQKSNGFYDNRMLNIIFYFWLLLLLQLFWFLLWRFDEWRSSYDAVCELCVLFAFIQTVHTYIVITLFIRSTHETEI